MTALIIATTAEPRDGHPVNGVEAPELDILQDTEVDLKKREAEAEPAKYANYYGTGTFADFF